MLNKNHKNVINIVNFIRAVEPRSNMDLYTPVVEQIKLLEQYNFNGTFLLQYDALIDTTYTDLLLAHKTDKIEIGFWFEIVEPLAIKAGLPWRGRYPWDWHANVGFSVGYTLEERERLIDVYMEEFYNIFSYYPKSIGSWTIDAHSLKYINEKYNLLASCVCKEQWGTDGYTIWGGYYAGGYYPSIKNMHSPAQTKDYQIDLPIFRMLGSDLIYQYDSGLDFNTGDFNEQGVITLEPVYRDVLCGGGGVPEWVDSYLNETFNNKCLSFAYTQAGQENSFGWEAMGDGLTYQFKKINELIENNVAEVLTLAQTGEWFKSQYKQTPATTGVVEDDYLKEGRKTVWYNCKNYRFNLYLEKNHFWIRDIYIFNEQYSERYFDEVCTKEYLEFDNLPLVDGARWGKNNIRSGLYPYIGDTPITFTDMLYDEDGDTAIVTMTDTACGDMIFTLTESNIKIVADSNFDLKLFFNKEFKYLPQILNYNNTELELLYNNFKYKIHLKEGVFKSDYSISSANNCIILELY